jgi:cytochrome c oxidase subunit 1
MFASGILGMPRRVATYDTNLGVGTLNLISTIGAMIIGLSMVAFAINLLISLAIRRPSGPDPWHANTLEWSTSSPPPTLNFTPEWPFRKVTSFTPLLDQRLAAAPVPDQVGTDGG